MLKLNDNFIRLVLVVVLASVSIVAQAQEVLTPANALIRRGKLEEAIELLTKATAQNKSAIFNLLGETWLKKGNSEKAIFYFEQAKSAAENASDKEQLAQANNNMAVALWAQGKSVEALQYHQVALQQRQTLKQPLLVAASYNNIGLVYSSSNPQLAIDYYRKAQHIYQTENLPEKLATSYVNIGLAFSNLKDFNAALSNLNKALDIRLKEFGAQSDAVAFVYSSLASVFLETNDSKFAVEYVQKAINIYKKSYGSQHPELAANYNLWGNINMAHYQYAEAIAHYKMALSANQTENNPINGYDLPPTTSYLNADIYLLSLYQLALAQESLHFQKTLKIKDIRYAYDLLGVADNVIDKIRQFRVNEADKIALGTMSSNVYEAAIRVSLYMASIQWKKTPYIEKGFYYTDKSKSAVLLEAIADANAQSYAGIPDEMLSKEKEIKGEIAYLNQKMAQAAPADRSALTEKLLEWNQKYNAFKRKLETQYPSYFSLKYNIETPTVTSLQLKLQEGTTLVNYFIGENNQRLYIFYVSSKGVTAKDMPLDASLEKNLTGFRNAIYYKAGATTEALGNKLFQDLGLNFLPKTTKHLVVVPAGRIATIPFEALNSSYETTIHYLVQDMSVSYVYAASLLPDGGNKQAGDVSLFAPVEFSRQGLSYLPGTKQEVEQISSLFASKNTPTNVYLEANASKEAVTSPVVAQSKTLHFATHGIVDEKHPERSRICLTMQNGSSGNLFTGDIYTLNFDADLVVLSACETGLGMLSKGEGIIGLTRAIIYAGAKNMVVSLWSVADTSTSQLMIDFYKNTLNNQSYAQALAHAKRNMLHSADYSDPYYWAPFVLIGK